MMFFWSIEPMVALVPRLIEQPMPLKHQVAYAVVLVLSNNVATPEGCRYYR